MTLLSWLVAPALGSCHTPIIDGYYGPIDYLEWPFGTPVPPDTILVVHRSVPGDVGALQLLDPAGVEVPATRVDVAPQWVVLVPDAPLAVGVGYTLVTETPYYSPRPFDVSDGTAGDVEPALVPIRRNTFSEMLREDDDCPEQVSTRHGVDYLTCGTGALLVAVVAETEPPVPATVADLGELDGVGGSGDTIFVTDGLTVGEATTIWLGAFDGVGRFQGWVGDPITMPEAGTVRLEYADDAVGAYSSPAYLVCPPVPVAWTSTFEQTCTSWESSGLECNEDPDQPSGPDVCGCATGVNGAWGASALLGLLVARRRRADGMVEAR